MNLRNSLVKLFSNHVTSNQMRHYSSLIYYSPHAQIDTSIIKKFSKLKIPKTKFPVTYVWIDGTGENLRSKTKIVDFKPKCIEELPCWSYDGSSTYQADAKDSDLTLRPVAMYKDPFVKGGILALCDTYKPSGEPTGTNHRVCCVDALDQACDCKPWFGMEQEYTLLGSDWRPWGWMPTAYPLPQGPYYCGVGAGKAYARQLIDAHFLACLFMDLSIAGHNAEVMPAQWEFQIGPCEGIDCADELWISRYVLQRIGELYGIIISLDPKPMEGDWNGAGCHCNFSTVESRKDDGLTALEKYIEKLKAKHPRHIAAYDPKQGEDNKRRLTGKHETANIREFTSGVSNRAVSIRIPRQVAKDKKGHLEDRRPSANCDPYSVMNVIIRTCILDQ